MAAGGGDDRIPMIYLPPIPKDRLSPTRQDVSALARGSIWSTTGNGPISPQERRQAQLAASILGYRDIVRIATRLSTTDQLDPIRILTSWRPDLRIITAYFQSLALNFDDTNKWNIFKEPVEQASEAVRCLKMWMLEYSGVPVERALHIGIEMSYIRQMVDAFEKLNLQIVALGRPQDNALFTEVVMEIRWHMGVIEDLLNVMSLTPSGLRTRLRLFGSAVNFLTSRPDYDNVCTNCPRLLKGRQEYTILYPCYHIMCGYCYSEKVGPNGDCRRCDIPIEYEFCYRQLTNLYYRIYGED